MHTLPTHGSAPWVVYRVADILKMDSIDSCLVSPECGECCGELTINFRGDGRFERFCDESDCSEFEKVTFFTFEDILDVKREDEWYELVVDSISTDLSRPLCRIVDGTVHDGHHRIAAAVELGMKYIVAEQVDHPSFGDDWQREFHPYY